MNLEQGPTNTREGREERELSNADGLGYINSASAHLSSGSARRPKPCEQSLNSRETAATVAFGNLRAKTLQTGWSGAS